MDTKFGSACLNAEGYYQITSRKEGNRGKYLHRLIFEDFYNIILPENIVIHHEDGNPLNNEIWNLIPMTLSEHISLHQKGNQHFLGKSHSEETKRKISENNARIFKGKKMPLESKIKSSINKNRTGYFRVIKKKKSTTKQGFQWVYRWYENHKRHSIYSIDLKTLEEKVKSKGLEWINLNEMEVPL